MSFYEYYSIVLISILTIIYSLSNLSIMESHSLHYSLNPSTTTASSATLPSMINISIDYVQLIFDYDLYPIMTSIALLFTYMLESTS